MKKNAKKISLIYPIHRLTLLCLYHEVSLYSRIEPSGWKCSQRGQMHLCPCRQIYNSKNNSALRVDMRWPYTVRKKKHIHIYRIQKKVPSVHIRCSRACISELFSLSSSAPFFAQGLLVDLSGRSVWRFWLLIIKISSPTYDVPVSESENIRYICKYFHMCSNKLVGPDRLFSLPV